jgi:uncharacterized RDD family membrane protein YckC
MKLSLGSRISSALIDYFIMSIIPFILFIPFALVVGKTLNGGYEVPNYILYASVFLFVLGLSLYFFKDIFNGRSIGKRLMNLQIVDDKTGDAASPLQTVVRDITSLLFPIEVVFLLLNPAKRLGDMIAGTRVVMFDKTKDQKPQNWLKTILAVIFVLVIFTGVFYVAANYVYETYISKTNFLNTDEDELEDDMNNLDSLYDFNDPTSMYYDSTYVDSSYVD